MTDTKTKTKQILLGVIAVLNLAYGISGVFKLYPNIGQPGFEFKAPPAGTDQTEYVFTIFALTLSACFALLSAYLPKLKRMGDEMPKDKVERAKWLEKKQSDPAWVRRNSAFTLALGVLVCYLMDLYMVNAAQHGWFYSIWLLLFGPVVAAFGLDSMISGKWEKNSKGQKKASGTTYVLIISSLVFYVALVQYQLHEHGYNLF